MITARSRKVTFSRRALVLVLTAAALLAACEPSYDSTIGANLVNWERDVRGIHRLPRADDLDTKAQAHAVWMARNKTLAHSSLTAGVSGSYTVLAENVGVGSSMAQVHLAFMASSGHRANILNGKFKWIGVGEARASNGQIYVAIVFKG